MMCVLKDMYSERKVPFEGPSKGHIDDIHNFMGH